MHCYICDREDDLITYDKLRGEYSPCSVCQAIIEETLEEFEEADTEDFPPMDHAESGRRDRVHSASVQPEGEA